MKAKRVTKDDINHALYKINQSGAQIDNYIFITTDVIDLEVKDYAASLYDEMGGSKLLFWIVLAFYAIFYICFTAYDWSFWKHIKDLCLPNRKVQSVSP